MADIPCIKKAAELMGESMSKEDVQKFFDNMVNRTKVKAAQEGIPIEEAARIVAQEVAEEEKLLSVIFKKKELRNFQSQKDLLKTAQTGKSLWAKSIQKQIQKVMDAGRAIGNVYTGRFFAGLNEDKLIDLFNTWKSPELSRPIFLELEQLNLQYLGRESNVGITGNAKAKAIAERYFGIRMEIQARKNRWGANIEEAPGYVMLQTHNSQTMRRMGKGTVFGKESIGRSYLKWRGLIDSLRIDWDRTLAGDDHDAFLKGFHDAIYTGTHGNPIDEATKVKKFRKPGTSLADKLGSQRVLWFKDAESAFKYNEVYGVYGVQDAILADLRNSGRNIAMLQYFGANPVDNIHAVQDKLRTAAKDIDNAQEQTQALNSRLIDGQIDLMTGKANVSTRPWLTASVDFIKNVTLTSKGGGIVFSALTDKAFMQSRMTYEGLSQLQKIGAQAVAFTKQNPKFAAELGVYNQSWAGATNATWADEVKPVLFTNKLVEWTMKGQGLNRWTYHHHSAMGTALAGRMGLDSKLPFDKLEPRRQAVLREAGVEPRDWEAIRQSVFESDGEKLVFPSGAHELADDVIDSLVDGPRTPAARKRARDLLESKFDYYIHDSITQAIPTPGAREQSIRTLNGIQRGEWSRELSELFFIFKGFTLKATMDTSARARNLGGWSGAMHVFSLVAQAGVLGYASMTAKDALKGRTPRRLIEDDGTINGKVWFESVIRGGGMGIYGDFLNAAYDRRVNSVTQAAMGPAIGELFNVGRFAVKATKGAVGDDVENLGYDGFKLIENQLPLINLFPLKQVMDHFIMWQVKEALSPGVYQRQKQSIEDHNYQEVWIDPVTN